MGQIIRVDIGVAGLDPDTLPEPGKISHRLAGHGPGKQNATALRRGGLLQPDQCQRLMGNWNPLAPALLGVDHVLGPDRQIKVGSRTNGLDAVKNDPQGQDRRSGLSVESGLCRQLDDGANFG